MDSTNENLMDARADERLCTFFKRKKILNLLRELDSAINDLDVTYEEVRGWERG
jgi:hypothetical protein